ncbi:hypothetical protein SISNIDRAFT_489997 [Sistotremastrum niveocremeum HHB9708]|uniref:Uncharacterized protein n=1 Tax=Sistotremastrum niveocremeum HHB9708 TaxID=1314777 RepID=A0A164PBS5_9AGAM|nr:hypothetical protein SISNIDRAFT_489997 [Sistotremastrum niveocremeum HHB9708]
MNPISRSFTLFLVLSLFTINIVRALPMPVPAPVSNPAIPDIEDPDSTARMIISYDRNRV